MRLPDWRLAGQENFIVEDWAIRVLNGVTYGGLLFLLASGFTLGLGIMKIVNIAHGAFYLLTAYIAWSVFQETDSFLLTIVVCCAGRRGACARPVRGPSPATPSAAPRADIGHDGRDPDRRGVRCHLVGRLSPYGRAARIPRRRPFTSELFRSRATACSCWRLRSSSAFSSGFSSSEHESERS